MIEIGVCTEIVGEVNAFVHSIAAAAAPPAAAAIVSRALHRTRVSRNKILLGLSDDNDSRIAILFIGTRRELLNCNLFSASATSGHPTSL